MGITVRVHNKNDQWIKMDRACFGFLSYISSWDEDDAEGWSDGFTPKGLFGIKGFSSGDLVSVDYIEDAHSMSFLDHIRAAMDGLPQYYGNVTVDDSGMDRHDEAVFNIPLSDAKCMQVPVIAGMMLRNILSYSSYKNSFEALLGRGIPAPIAFVFAQGFPYRYNAFDPTQKGFYRAWGGDETIFTGQARLCDMIHMLKGGLGDAWQGPFGDTAEGYGRNGSYDGDEAPRSDRTRYGKSLADLTLVTDKEIWKDSPNLNTVMFEGCGRIEENSRLFISVDEFVNNLYPKIQELLK